MIKIPPTLDIGRSKYKLNKGIFTGKGEDPAQDIVEEEMQQFNFTSFRFFIENP